jgi:hypothetical protein
MGTEGQGFFYRAEWWVKVQFNEIVVYTFHLNILAVVRTMKEKIKTVFYIKYYWNIIEYFWKILLWAILVELAYSNLPL